MIQPPPPRGERLGAIDVGSNSIRLLVADWDPRSGISVIDEVKDQPRLAQGLAATGRLDREAMARAFDARASGARAERVPKAQPSS